MSSNYASCNLVCHSILHSKGDRSLRFTAQLLIISWGLSTRGKFASSQLLRMPVEVQRSRWAWRKGLKFQPVIQCTLNSLMKCKIHLTCCFNPDHVHSRICSILRLFEWLLEALLLLLPNSCVLPPSVAGPFSGWMVAVRRRKERD